ncbi:MAG: hypothetical protein IJW70_09770 [Clostridia bacterium]|nr:hypothetical protein [Clostridia bacterium]
MLVFTDCRISREAAQGLLLHGHTPLPCPPHPSLDPAIASHPDMLLLVTQGGIFTHADYAPLLHELSPRLPLVPIAQSVQAQYPRDVLLNAAFIGQRLVCRPDATAAEVLDLARNKGVCILPVRQGYAKCNTCIVSEHAVITEDKSIANALANTDLDVLLIAPGHVTLPGYAYGFIGGASGSDGKHVFFCGNLTAHPQGERIAAFCAAHGKQAISLANHPLTDVGSLLFFKSASEQ